MHTPEPAGPLPESLWSRIRHFLFGKPRDLFDPALGHQISLVPFLAWIGLGADGLSSSAYGPDEAYRALGPHTYLAPFLVIATAVTVLIISYTYSKIIEHFPEGGGGYMVATRLLGHSAGVVSGAALLVDYILTITVSVAAGGDAVFSLLPLEWHEYKVPVEYAAIFFLLMMNLRGVRESVKVIVPVFMTFIVSHALLMLWGIFSHLDSFGMVTASTQAGLESGKAAFGTWGLFLLFIRAYSMGGGTYTGIEAVSNGLAILREPKIETGKRTMVYMATSLAITAGGLLLCYMLFQVEPMPGQTLNATLVETLAGSFELFGIGVGRWFVWITMFSAAALLFVAAQTGFLGGPRVMANMATDSWLPKRFAALSDRLTSQRGIVLIGVAALVTLAYTGGDVRILVVMYSINVFVTFSLSQLGMCRFWIARRSQGGAQKKRWMRNFALHFIGLLLCGSILVIMLLEKLQEGGWVTVVVTTALIVLCFTVRRHYRNVSKLVKEVDQMFEDIPVVPLKERRLPKLDPNKPTAVILVGGGSGRTGIHTLLNIFRLFPDNFKNVVFVSVGIINSDIFKGEIPVHDLEERVKKGLEYYVELAQGLEVPATSYHRIGADVVEEASDLCVEISKKFPRSVFFASELVFQEPHWYHRLLHNETAYAIQRQLRFAGLSLVIIPILLYNREAPVPSFSDSLIYRGISPPPEKPDQKKT